VSIEERKLINEKYLEARKLVELKDNLKDDVREYLELYYINDDSVDKENMI